MFLEERIQEILRQLGELRYPMGCTLPGWEVKRVEGPVKPGQVNAASGWEELKGEGWGEEGAYLAFRREVLVPREYEGYPLEFTLHTGREGGWDATNPQMALYVDGRLCQGMDVNHTSHRLTDCSRGGESYSLFLSAYRGSESGGVLFQAALRCVDKRIEKAYYDLRAPWEVLRLLDKEEQAYLWLLPRLNQAVNLLDLRRGGDESFFDSLSRMEEYLEKNLYGEVRLGRQALSQIGSHLPALPRVVCVGHTHIDVAWLWTLSITRDKALRSFATVLDLMDQYPEYTFLASQPQLYAYVKEASPQLYERIRQRVAEGRWEAEGAMWVEADCNLTSGESLVRQILYGKRFFREEFGRDSHILWLPDVFGYSAALPQILKKSGIDYFVTTKISWNEKNKMPYDTFLWKGIDGSRVLSHFITTREYTSPKRREVPRGEEINDFTTSYNGNITPSQIKGAWQRYQQKAVSDQVLCCYGYGDGGGGPTREMLEMGRRLSAGIPGCPQAISGTALEFLRSIDQEKCPCWVGELYLEYHRGTYTSMGRNKRYNRRAEFAALNLETYGLLGEELLGEAYPGELLERGWEVILRNQFHDILPGSAIREVYEESQREYLSLLEGLEGESARLLEALSRALVREGNLLVVNPNGVPLSTLAELSREEGERLLAGGENEVKEAKEAKEASEAKEAKEVKEGRKGLALQRTREGTYLCSPGEVPPRGFLVVDRKALIFPQGGEASGREAVQFEIEGEEGEIRGLWVHTPFARLHLNAHGQIERWTDLQEGERELFPAGERGNVFMAYEDKPLRYDNWSLEDYYREKSWEIEEVKGFEVSERGPLRYRVSLCLSYGDSTIREDLFFYPDTPRVDIGLWMDWREDQIFLKLLFPLDLNVNTATYDIQYGNVTRPTHTNTSWDEARFETCYHKWADLSEAGFGVSFLSDCKYGISVEGSRVGLSLLKSGRYPNPEADREQHLAGFSVYPHLETWREAATVWQAYGRNNPLVALAGRRKGESERGKPERDEAFGEEKPGREGILPGKSYSLAHCRERNLCVEVCKRAQRGQGQVLRLYEFENRRTRAHLVLGRTYARVWLCSLLEEKERLLAFETGEVELLVGPYEIITLLLEGEDVCR